MATIIRIPRKSGARAPQRVSGINWASPLAQGLKHAYIPRYGSMLDLGQERELLPHDATSPPSGIKSVDGIVMMNGASGGHVVDSNGTALVGSSTDTNGYTAAGWAETPIIDDANSRFRYFFGASTSTRGFALGLKAHTSSDNIRGVHFRIKHGDSLSVVPDNPNSPPIAGKAQLYTGTWTPGDGARAYLDGIFVRYSAFTDSDSQMSSLLEIGQTPDPQNWTNNTHTWDGGVGPCFLWNRPLSDAEMRALYNPQTRWDIYNQGTRTYLIPGVSAAAIAMARYTRQRDTATLRRHLVAAWAASAQSSGASVIFNQAGGGRHIRI